MDVLTALGAAQLSSDSQMFSALAQLSSLSSNMGGGMNNDSNEHDIRSKSSSSSKQNLVKPSSSTNKTSQSSSSSSSQKSQPSKKSDSAAFYSQGLDLSLKQQHQRQSARKSDHRSKSPLSDD